MDFQKLYVLKYKKGMVGPQTAFILASSDKRAEDVGKKYCGTIPGCRYITAFKAVLATEDILGDAEMLDIDSPVGPADYTGEGAVRPSKTSETSSVGVIA